METLAIWQMLASGFFGCIVTGATMVLRGDFLGRRAADQVEIRLNARMDREYADIKAQLNRIEDKLQ